MRSEAATVFLMGASLGTGNRGVSALGASLVKLILQACPEAGISMLIGHRSAKPFELIMSRKKLEIPISNFRMSPKARFTEHLLWWLLLSICYRVVPVHSFRGFLRRRHPLIRASAEADLIGDIRGGDSFSDIYGLRNFLLGSLPVIAVLLVRGQIVLFPQTYGPCKSWLARRVARFILRRASLILSRDRESMATVEAMIGRTDRCLFCPDVAFALEARSPEKLQIDPPLPSEFPLSAFHSPLSATPPPSPVSAFSFPLSAFPNLIGLNVNGLMFNGGYTRKNMFGLKLDYAAFLVAMARRLLAEPDTRLLLVPHTFAPPTSVESDPAACREIRRALPEELRSRVHMVEGEYDQSEIKNVIGMCDFFIGSRMHACIAALSQGIPAIGVAYSKKFKGVFETVGAEDSVIDGREMDVEQALQKAMSLYERRDATRAELQSTVPPAQAQLQNAFQQLLAGGKQSAKNGTQPIVLQPAACTR